MVNDEEADILRKYEVHYVYRVLSVWFYWLGCVRQAFVQSSWLKVHLLIAQ